MSRASLPILLIGSLSLLLVAVPAAATFYTVRLDDGSSFVTRYKPLDAHFDSSQIMFLTDVGNWIVLPKSMVVEIITDTEAKGFGLVIDNTTIMMGRAPNDTGEMSLDQDWAAAQAVYPGASQTSDTPPPYSMPMVGEPNEGGGIPTGWIGVTTPPMSPAGSEPVSGGEF